MDQINESTTCIITMSFFDESNVALTPDTIDYVLYDKFSGTQKRTGTLTPATSVALEITPAQNAILDQTNRYEIAVLQVTFTSGTKQCNDTYPYQINNLSSVV